MGRFLDAQGNQTSDESKAAKDPKTGQPVENGLRNICGEVLDPARSRPRRVGDRPDGWAPVPRSRLKGYALSSRSPCSSA